MGHCLFLATALVLGKQAMIYFCSGDSKPRERLAEYVLYVDACFYFMDTVFDTFCIFMLFQYVVINQDYSSSSLFSFVHLDQLFSNPYGVK